MLFSYDEQWLVEKRIRIAAFKGVMNSKAMREADERVMADLDSAPGPVHLVSDPRALDAFPSLDECRRLRHISHPHLGWYLTIGASNQVLFRVFVSILMRWANIHYKDVASPEEAIEFLHSVDPSLAPFISG